SRQDLPLVLHGCRYRGELLEGGARSLGDDPRQRRLARSRRPIEDRRADAVLADRQPQRRALAEHLLLPDELVEAARAQAQRQRSRFLDLRAGRVCEEVAHAGKYAPAVATGQVEDFSEPILGGEGASDHERSLRTDQLLSLQKTPEEQAHRDELLFQTVHQSSELWLKLASNETAEAAALVEREEIAGALRLLRRASLALQLITGQLDML